MTRAYCGSFATRYECNAKRPMSASANNALPPVNRRNESAIGMEMAMWNRAGNRTAGVCRFLAVAVAACVPGLVLWVSAAVASGVMRRPLATGFLVQCLSWRAKQLVKMGDRLPQLWHKVAQQPLAIEGVGFPQDVGHHGDARVPDGILAGFDVDVAAPQHGFENGIQQVRLTEHGHPRILPFGANCTIAILDRFWTRALARRLSH